MVTELVPSLMDDAFHEMDLRSISESVRACLYIEMEHYINRTFCRKEFEGALLQHHLVFGSTYDIKLLPKHTVAHHKCCHNSHNFV